MIPAPRSLARSATKLVWTLAGLGLAGCVLCSAFLFVAFQRVDAMSSERSALSSEARSLVDLFGKYCNAVGEHLHEHLDTDTPTEHCDPAMGGLTRMLRNSVQSAESKAGTDTLLAMFNTYDSAFHSLEEQAAKWHEEQVKTDTQTKATFARALDSVTSIRSALSSYTGRARLRRLAAVRAYREAAGDHAAQLAAQLLTPSSELLPYAGAETELSDLALYALQLANESKADRAASIRENSIKPALARLDQAVSRINAEPGDSDEAEHMTSDLIVLGQILVDRGADAPSLSTLSERRAILAAERTMLAAQIDKLVADLHLSGQTVLSFLAESHTRSDERLAKSIGFARAGCVLLLAGLAASTIALGRRVSGSLRHQATELQNSNAKLDLAVEEANAANRAKTDFLANMSHEIRTPMTAILGFADLLADPTIAAPDRDQHIQIIRRQGEHLLTIINDILDLAKIDLDRLTVEHLPANPCLIVHEVVTLLGTSARTKGLPLLLAIDSPTPPDILTDPLRLRQILINLVGNAIKFTASGNVRLTVRWDPGERTLRFDVRDSGVGLSPEQIQRLFKPFAQADETMSRRFGGTGIGLYLSQCLAQRLGGQISIESAPGQGSVFSLVIPAEIAEQPAAIPIPMTPARPPAPKPARQSLQGLKILYAEDGPDNQRLIGHHLRVAGAEVIIAENGRIAIDRATESAAAGASFDLILMDMQMPELDGYAATAKLRELNYPCPIIALTAHAMTGDRERCIAAGCADYLTKPIDRDTLLSTCAQLARKASVA